MIPTRDVNEQWLTKLENVVRICTGVTGGGLWVGHNGYQQINLLMTESVCR